MKTIHEHTMLFLILKLEVAGQVAIETAVRVEDAPELSKSDVEVYVNKVPTMNQCVCVCLCVCLCVCVYTSCTCDKFFKFSNSLLF